MQVVGGIRVQTAPGPDRSTTTYNWAGPFGSQPGIVRRYVDPMALVGEMINPFPRTMPGVRRPNNKLVSPPNSNAVRTLNVSAPTAPPTIVNATFMPAQDSGAEASAVPGSIASEPMGVTKGAAPPVKEESMASPSVKSEPQNGSAPEPSIHGEPAQEELFEEAPEVPHQSDVAPQAAPEPDAQVEVMEEIADSRSMVPYQAPPPANDGMLGLTENSAIEAGVNPAPLQLEWHGSFPADDEMSDLQLLFGYPEGGGVELVQNPDPATQVGRPRVSRYANRDIIGRRAPRRPMRGIPQHTPALPRIEAAPAPQGVVQVGGIIQVPVPFVAPPEPSYDTGDALVPSAEEPMAEVAEQPGKANIYELPEDTASVTSKHTVSKPGKQRKKREGQTASGTTAAAPAAPKTRLRKTKGKQSTVQEVPGESSDDRKGKRKAT